MKKTIAIILVFIFAIMIPCATFANAAGVYEYCKSKVGTSADHYSGVRIVYSTTTVRGKTKTLVRYMSVPSNAGFVSNVMRKADAINGLKTSYELQAMSVRIPSVKDGAILFYQNKFGIQRIGVYAGNYQFYIKNKVVVMEPYNAKYWSEIRWIPTM